MYQKPECIFSILGEGGGISISRITVNGEQRFVTDHREVDFSDEGLDVNRKIGYSSFDEAFNYISKYPWHRLSLNKVHEDYKLTVLDRLMEVLNDEDDRGRYYPERKRSEHEELFSATIYRDPSGVWKYHFGRRDSKEPDKFEDTERLT